MALPINVCYKNNIDEFLKILDSARSANKKIVLTNGCFDLLHIGHTRYLQQARDAGDILVVGLNSDLSVKGLKQKNRPIINEDERAELMVALKSVDYVVIFDERTAEDLLMVIKPDIYVKGGDYTLENLPEAGVIKQLNIEVKFIPFVDGHSTTSLIEKIAQSV